MEEKEYIIALLNNISSQADNAKFSARYQYENRHLPRVTEILSSMLHEEYLMNWANSLGWKRKGYRATLNEAANKGTYAHNSIEHFLKEGIEPDIEVYPIDARDSVYHTFYSFKEWWERLISNNVVELIACEKRLVCPYFGGTLDCLLRINGKVWLIDFKTSNHFGYKYSLQLSAYDYMLDLEGIHVDGCLVLLLDKNEIGFHEYILDLEHNEEHKSFFQNCRMEFLSLVMAYYGRLQIESQCKSIFGRK